MNILYYIILAIYCICLTYITVFCLMQLSLLFKYKKFYKKNPFNGYDALEDGEEWPFVTIQLPVYNELYVVERLINSVVKMDYPKDRFEIQVLDDSTDESIEIAAKRVAHFKEMGFQIEQIRRPERKGYKAGALQYGMKSAKGEFIAIFDADFLPKSDFLKTTIAHFKDKKVGVVQTRWQHINEEYSLLTRMQALQLNVHFTVEQKGREIGNYLLQFNGTAGVWRRKTIDEAGGWQADTLTEDLDLSYRAQMKGWKITFLEKFGSPAELPAEMNSLKSQQFRWMKGGAETAKKLWPTVRKSNLPLSQKFHAFLHLFGSTVFVFIFLSAIVSVPLVFILPEIKFNTSLFFIFMLGVVSIAPVYYTANVNAEIKEQSFRKKIYKFLILFPVFLVLSMGLSLHNTIAVFQGWLGKQTAFIRTPKFNIQKFTDTFTQNKYVKKKIGWTTVFESLMVIYFGLGLVAGIYLKHDTFIIFHFMLMIGFFTIAYMTIKHTKLQ